MFRNRRGNEHSPAGFTLIELLVVVAIIAVLIGLLIPAVQKVRDSAARTQCSNNLHQLGIAVANCNDTVGTLPPLYGSYGYRGANATSSTLHFWLLPYIEQENLYNVALNPNGSGDYNPNAFPAGNIVAAYYVKTYVCPADPSIAPNTGLAIGGSNSGNIACTTYAANGQVFGQASTRTPPDYTITNGQGNARIPSSFTDGVSQTILFTEKYGTCTGSASATAGSFWANQNGISSTYNPFFAANFDATANTYTFQVKPNPFLGNCDFRYPSSPHTNGIQALMGDGSVSFVANGVTATTFWAATTPADGDVVGSDF